MTRKTSVPVIFQGLAVGLKMFRWVVILMLILFLGSGITSVTSEGVGLQLRFGRLIGPPHEPGLVMALPFPIDVVTMVPTEQEGEVVIEELWRKGTGTTGQDKIDPLVEGYCLTGDQNIVQARVIAKYRIIDPVRFQLGFVALDELVRDIVMVAMNHTITHWRIDDVLRLQRPLADAPDVIERLETSIRQGAQRRLDDLNTGVRLSTIEFNEIQVPRHVIAAFQEVQSAKITIETAQREAEGYRASRLPEAEAAMNRMIQEATAYQSSAVADAEAELAVFQDLFVEYQKAPELVRQRIFMETLETVFQNVGALRLVAPHTRVIIPDHHDH